MKEKMIQKLRISGYIIAGAIITVVTIKVITNARKACKSQNR